MCKCIDVIIQELQRRYEKIEKEIEANNNEQWRLGYCHSVNSSINLLYCLNDIYKNKLTMHVLLECEAANGVFYYFFKPTLYQLKLLQKVYYKDDMEAKEEIYFLITKGELKECRVDNVRLNDWHVKFNI